MAFNMNNNMNNASATDAHAHGHADGANANTHAQELPSLYQNGVTSQQTRNSPELQERWKTFYLRAQQRFRHARLNDEDISYTYILSQTFHEEVEHNDYVTPQYMDRLAMGCGCCRRHSHGIFENGVAHCIGYCVEQPQSFTLEGKPCDCPCRSFARLLSHV